MSSSMVGCTARIFRGVRGIGFGLVTLAPLGWVNTRALPLPLPLRRLGVTVNVESSISLMDVREERGEERALEEPLLKGQKVAFPAVFQSMTHGGAALGEVAELEGRGKTLSKVEFFPLETLEVPRLCFRDFTREGLVFERWKNCRYRPDDPLLDALPVKKEKGLLNL